MLTLALALSLKHLLMSACMYHSEGNGDTYVCKIKPGQVSGGAFHFILQITWILFCIWTGSNIMMPILIEITTV